jgi:hypothetical protein
VPDKFWQIWDIRVVRHLEPRAEIVPDGDFEFCAGLDETEEGVAAVAAGIASGASADLTPGDLTADVVLRPVGVEWDFGPIEHHQQFALVGMEPCEETVEGDEAGVAREDAIEACLQGCLALRGRMLAIGFESAIEPPD